MGDFMVMASGGKLFVECLNALSVKHIFTLPGSGIMSLFEALADTREIRTITVRHQQIAAHMADGYARVSGRPGVALVEVIGTSDLKQSIPARYFQAQTNYRPQ